MTVTILTGDALEQLKTMPDESVHCCVVSPPYWSLRNYGTAEWKGGAAACKHKGSDRFYLIQTAASVAAARVQGGRGNAERLKEGRWRERGTCVKCGAVHTDHQIGLESTPEEYVAAIVGVFEEVRRVLRSDGTLWLNLGDCYAGSGRGGDDYGTSTLEGGQQTQDASKGKGTRKGDEIGKTSRTAAVTNVGRRATRRTFHNQQKGSAAEQRSWVAPPAGLKNKDLIGLPWMVAFALRAAGWWLRSDTIWHKPNPMPESIDDRPTKSHEYLFLLSKSERYFYDATAIAEPAKWPPGGAHHDVKQGGFNDKGVIPGHDQRAFRAIRETRNKRSVWTIATVPYKGAHFATFPPALAETCILAGTSARGCCPKCTSPWRRVLSRRFVPQHDVAREKGVRGAGDQKPLDEGNGRQGYPRGTNETRTLGWYPTCSCDETDPLLAYPPRPKAKTEAAEGRWQKACERIDEENRLICTLIADRPVIPATVLDCFAGAGTTAVVADRINRHARLIELNPKYVKMIRARLHAESPLFHADEAAE